MKTQQELQMYYWGPLYEMVKKYNTKHDCDVKPWECVIFAGVTFSVHPTFDGSSVDYDFALTILYDAERKEHRPVFVGDKVYDKKIPKELEVIDSDTLQYKILKFTDLDWDKISWNPPTPKKWYRVGEDINGNLVFARNEFQERRQESQKGFKRWLPEGRKYYD